MEGIAVETGEKIGFFERLKIAIFKFEDYAKLAAQKISKAVKMCIRDSLWRIGGRSK